MALITCPECGKMISDKAPACPNCGLPIELANSIPLANGVIHFIWEGRQGDSIRKTKIVVDGAEIGVMRCGDRIDVPVQLGRHNLQLFQGKHLLLEGTVDLNIHSIEETFSYRERMGFSHPVLERVDGPKMSGHRDVPRCPTCGSEKIKKLSLTRKALSFEVVGFASGSIGKTFQCKNCGYKW